MRLCLLPGRLTLRTLSVLTLGTAVLTASWASPATADISAQIRAGQAQLDQLNTRAEAAAERYNAGRIALSAAQRKLATTSASVARDDAGVARLRSTAGAFAAHVYESGTGGFGMSVLTSDQGPGTLLDRLGSLDRVARHQSDVLDTLRVARTLQAEAQLRAQTARDEARTTFTQLQSDKLSVERSATQAQSVLQQLQVKQAQLVQAAKDAAARQAAQTRAAALAAEARANASLAAFRAQAAAVVPQPSSRSRSPPRLPSPPSLPPPPSPPSPPPRPSPRRTPLYTPWAAPHPSRSRPRSPRWASPTCTALPARTASTAPG